VKWFLVTKEKDKFPTNGTYKDWKPLLRKEGKQQCVYCAIKEAIFGGYRNFHVEHFKPKSKFKDLENDYSNLFYVCSICNAFKGNDWPEGVDEQKHPDVYAYPSPAVHDYATFLAVDAHGAVVSNQPAGSYLIERVYLNRPQLMRMRRVDRVVHEVDGTVQDLRDLAAGKQLPPDLTSRCFNILSDAVSFLTDVRFASPYEPEEVERARAQ
jgi:uncharacterized protein (TIGR02646 family)